MTPKRLIERVEFWRQRLAPEWRITIWTDGPFDEDDEAKYNACVQPDDDYHHAKLWVRPDFRRSAAVGEVDVTIVHEILHLLTREHRRVFDHLDGQLHRDVLQVARRQYDTAEEAFVERLARIVALLEHPDGLVYGVDIREAA